MTKEKKQKKSTEKLSIRTSVVVWLGGAVLGWVAAVLAIYTLLRAPDSSIATKIPESNGIEQAASQPESNGNPADLSKIEPAAGQPPETGQSPEAGQAKTQSPLK